MSELTQEFCSHTLAVLCKNMKESGLTAALAEVQSLRKQVERLSAVPSKRLLGSSSGSGSGRSGGASSSYRSSRGGSRGRRGRGGSGQGRHGRRGAKGGAAAAHEGKSACCCKTFEGLKATRSQCQPPDKNGSKEGIEQDLVTRTGPLCSYQVDVWWLHYHH
jgi:hypothetical protein